MLCSHVPLYVPAASRTPPRTQTLVFCSCSERPAFESRVRQPTPVFFTAIETGSASQQATLDAALAAMTLEDPSVHVRIDHVTGQQLLGGMGELHLQVVADRLRREHKLELYTGAMQVRYMTRPDLS